MAKECLRLKAISKPCMKRKEISCINIFKIFKIVSFIMLEYIFIQNRFKGIIIKNTNKSEMMIKYKKVSIKSEYDIEV